MHITKLTTEPFFLSMSCIDKQRKGMSERLEARTKKNSYT
jgi:hypothetical protein